MADFFKCTQRIGKMNEVFRFNKTHLERMEAWTVCIIESNFPTQTKEPLKHHFFTQSYVKGGFLTQTNSLSFASGVAGFLPRNDFDENYV